MNAQAVEQLRFIGRQQGGQAGGFLRVGVGFVHGHAGHGLVHGHALEHAGHVFQRGGG